MSEPKFEWQKTGAGEFPTLNSVDINALKKCISNTVGRDDIRLEDFYIGVKQDHIELRVVVQIR